MIAANSSFFSHLRVVSMRSQQVVVARCAGKQIYYRFSEDPMRDFINNAAFQTMIMAVAAQ